MTDTNYHDLASEVIVALPKGGWMMVVSEKISMKFYHPDTQSTIYVDTHRKNVVITLRGELLRLNAIKRMEVFFLTTPYMDAFHIVLFVHPVDSHIWYTRTIFNLPWGADVIQTIRTCLGVP